MCNTDIRNEIKKTGIYHWQVADALGVAENTFCRMLRTVSYTHLDVYKRQV